MTAGTQATATVELRDLVREAPDHWLLVPEGVGAGGEFRLLFATSGRRDASSSDIAVYNAFVQNAASGGHALVQDYSDHFAALGSTEAVEARVNTATTHTSTDQGVPIYWLNGPRPPTSTRTSTTAPGTTATLAGTRTGRKWTLMGIMPMTGFGPVPKKMAPRGSALAIPGPWDALLSGMVHLARVQAMRSLIRP